MRLWAKPTPATPAHESPLLPACDSHLMVVVFPQLLAFPPVRMQFGRGFFDHGSLLCRAYPCVARKCYAYAGSSIIASDVAFARPHPVP